MHADEDFSGYVGARWPALVRTLVLLGCPASIAPEAVTTGLARCRKDWPEIREYDDVDVLVHRSVIQAWQERLRDDWWTGLRPARATDWPLPDLSLLDRMTPEVRAGLVLRRFAALDQPKAVAVFGSGAGGPLPAVPDASTLLAAGESVVVYAPPDDEELTVARRGRPRWLVPAAGLVVLALALGGWAWWADRNAADSVPTTSVDLDQVDPNRARNPAEVAWYAEGVLHLDNATYPLPLLRDLVVVGAGAAYGDTEGRVVYLADDGSRTLLGTKDPTMPMVASDELGWVAWVDPAGAAPRLLVYDVVRREIIGERDLPPNQPDSDNEFVPRPVAIDGDTVYFVSAEGARGWRPIDDPSSLVTVNESLLYDVASRNRLSQVDADHVALDPAFFSTAYEVPGRGGQLSDDGNFAFTRSPDDASLLVYDVRSGERVDVEPPAADSIVDAVLAPEGAITYITVDTEAFPSQSASDSNRVEGSLVTCQLDDGSCEVAVRFVLDSEAPILAR